MREVAAAARVSLKSVSRVVNAEAGISPGLKRRVEAAVDRLQYRQNLHATSLRRADGRSATIGLLIGGSASPFSAKLHRSVENEALDRGFLVFAGSSDENAGRAREFMAAFAAHRVDGLIVVATTPDPRLLASEGRAGTAIVLVDDAWHAVNADHVLTDDIAAVRAAVRHLVNHGHMRIGYLASGAPAKTATRRHRGYVEELIACRVPFDKKLERLGIPDIAAAHAAAVELLSASDPPTAIFTADNQTTVGAHRAIETLGLCPRIGHVGFDEGLLLELLAAGVTVVAHDPEAIGRLAANLLFRRIEGDHSPPINVAIAPQVIARGSGEILV
jgi:LacI family transcriptional regulator